MTNRDPKIEKIETLLDKLGNTAVESFHYVALFIIGCMVIWSAGHTVYEILTIKQYASIDDIYCYSSTSNWVQWLGSILKPTTCLSAF